MKKKWVYLVEEQPQRRNELMRLYGSEKAYNLDQLDYQALIVVASMQQAFEQRVIADYLRVGWPALHRHDFIECIEPVEIWMSCTPAFDPTPIETLRVEPFQYHKKLHPLGGDWWRVAIYCCYLAISHKYKKVLYFVEDKPEIVDAPLRYVKELFDNTGPYF